MRCSIWIDRGGGRYDGIFVHANGTFRSCGKALLDYYKEISAINALIGLGHLLSIRRPEAHGGIR